MDWEKAFSFKFKFEYEVLVNSNEELRVRKSGEMFECITQKPEGLGLKEFLVYMNGEDMLDLIQENKHFRIIQKQAGGEMCLKSEFKTVFPYQDENLSCIVYISYGELLVNLELSGEKHDLPGEVSFEYSSLEDLVRKITEYGKSDTLNVELSQGVLKVCQKNPGEPIKLLQYFSTPGKPQESNSDSLETIQKRSTEAAKQGFQNYLSTIKDLKRNFLSKLPKNAGSGSVSIQRPKYNFSAEGRLTGFDTGSYQAKFMPKEIKEKEVQLKFEEEKEIQKQQIVRLQNKNSLALNQKKELIQEEAKLIQTENEHKLKSFEASKNQEIEKQRQDKEYSIETLRSELKAQTERRKIESQQEIERLQREIEKEQEEKRTSSHKLELEKKAKINQLEREKQESEREIQNEIKLINGKKKNYESNTQEELKYIENQIQDKQRRIREAEQAKRELERQLEEEKRRKEAEKQREKQRLEREAREADERRQREIQREREAQQQRINSRRKRKKKCLLF